MDSGLRRSSRSTSPSLKRFEKLQNDFNTVSDDEEAAEDVKKWMKDELKKRPFPPTTTSSPSTVAAHPSTTATTTTTLSDSSKKGGGDERKGGGSRRPSNTPPPSASNTSLTSSSSSSSSSSSNASPSTPPPPTVVQDQYVVDEATIDNILSAGSRKFGRIRASHDRKQVVSTTTIAVHSDNDDNEDDITASTSRTPKIDLTHYYHDIPASHRSFSDWHERQKWRERRNEEETQVICLTLDSLRRLRIERTDRIVGILINRLKVIEMADTTRSWDSDWVLNTWKRSSLGSPDEHTAIAHGVNQYRKAFGNTTKHTAEKSGGTGKNNGRHRTKGSSRTPASSTSSRSDNPPGGRGGGRGDRPKKE